MLSILTSTRAYIQGLAFRTKIIATAIVLLIVGFIAYTLSSGSPVDSGEVTTIPEVSVESVATLSENGTPLSLIGSVTSRTEATLLAESSGRITGVYKSLGDPVAAGTIIAELENSRERAAVTQARGAYDAARAALSKVSGSTRSEQLSILEINAQSARATVETSKQSAVNALLTAFAAIDDAIGKKTDVNFNNATSDSPEFIITTSSQQLAYEAESKRREIQGILNLNLNTAKTLTTTSDLQEEFRKTEEYMLYVRTYLDVVVDALNRGIESTSVSATTIATNKADATLARTSITAALSTLTSARQTLNSQITALEVAEKNLEQGVTGGQQEDVAAAEANVRSAEGSLALALANLERTIIRAPFTGTVNMLDAKIGVYASQGTPIATVANNGTLEVVATMTDRDQNAVAVGSTAIINGTAKATVTRIAPALDPITKKIEVRLALPIGASDLTNGASVRVDIDRVKGEATQISIPITALKLTPEGPIVFTVSSSNALVANKVVLGPLVGEKIIITDGLAGPMQIVIDARGRKEGDTVTVK
jgi:RND family efflux transporter MFP subunit